MMLAPKPLDNGKPIYELSHSGLNTLNGCARKYQINKRFLHPAGTNWDETVATMSGKAIHTHYQHLLMDYDQQQADYAFFKEWNFEAEERDTPYAQLHRGFTSSFYTSRWLAKAEPPLPELLASVKIDSGETIPAIEIKFNIILDHSSWKNSYHFRGLIDWVLVNPLDGTYKAVDAKTHRRPTLDSNHEYRFDTQTIPYGIVIQQATGQSVTAFTTEYLAVFVDIKEPRREILTYRKTNEDIEQWLRNLQVRINSIEMYCDDDVWPRSISGCSFYNRPCKHFKNCDITDKTALQNALLGFAEPVQPKPFGEDITVRLNLG